METEKKVDPIVLNVSFIYVSLPFNTNKIIDKQKH